MFIPSSSIWPKNYWNFLLINMPKREPSRCQIACSRSMPKIKCFRKVTADFDDRINTVSSAKLSERLAAKKALAPTFIKHKKERQT